jgi:predicted DsbA family dithiol-disulfide isomerase
VRVEIWSDIACPWCYVGKRRFEEALSRFPHREDTEVEYKSFELDPARAASGDRRDYADRLAAKYGMSRDQAEQMLDQMTQTAAGVGLDFRFDRAVPANTFEAHQLLHLAAAHGRQAEAKERLLRAYFTEGADMGDRATLVRLAEDAGLPAAEVEDALGDQRYAPAVRADEAEARSLGISGVPFFVVDRKYGVSGAQPAEQLLAVLEKAWSERVPLTVTGFGAPDGSADACGPDGCAI